MRKIWFIIIFLICCAFSGGIGYYLGKGGLLSISIQFAKPTPSPTIILPPTVLPQNSSIPVPSANPDVQVEDIGFPIEYANPSVAIDTIQTAIPSQQYNDLKPILAPNIEVIKYSTSCCGIIPKVQAISELSYLSGATGEWNFQDSNPLLPKLETAEPTIFKGNIVGTSADGYAVAFHLNDKLYVDKITIVGNYKLLLP